MVPLAKEDIRAISIVDIDQTLLRYEGDEKDQEWQGESWFLLTAAFKASISQHMEIFGAFRNEVNGNKDVDGELHDEMALSLINLWEESWGKPITRIALEAVCEYIKMKVSVEAQKAIADLIEHGILVIIGTGGFENSAQAIASLFELQEVVARDVDSPDINMWFGNTEFIFDENDILVTFHHKKDVIGYKRMQADKKIKELIDSLGLEDDIPLIAIGDGKSDMALFWKYFGIALRPTDNDLKMAAEAVVDNWEQAVAQALAYVNWVEEENEDNNSPVV
jgi:phosphoserine phosphatase